MSVRDDDEFILMIDNLTTKYHYFASIFCDLDCPLDLARAEGSLKILQEIREYIVADESNDKKELIYDQDC